MTTTKSLSELYQAFGAADDAWQAALVRKYGKHADDFRYVQAGRIDDLAPLHAEFERTGCEWRNHPENVMSKGCYCRLKHQKGKQD